MKIAFWNVKKNEKISPLLIDLISENALDVLVLAECKCNIEDVCKKVNCGSRKSFIPITNIGCDKISGIINSKYSQEILCSSSRYEILKVSTSYFSMIFGFIHAPSMLHYTDDDRRLCLETFYYDIVIAEKKEKSNNTIIIGDLNSNPFEKNIISAETLHGIPYKEEAKKTERTIQGKKYKMFYNPMWKFVGLQSPPYGTYYNNNSSSVNYYWYVFDQILLRPELLSAYDESSLEIIKFIKGKSLLEKNYKPQVAISDHLPIVFDIQEEKII